MEIALEGHDLIRGPGLFCAAVGKRVHDSNGSAERCIVAAHLQFGILLVNGLQGIKEEKKKTASSKAKCICVFAFSQD